VGHDSRSASPPTTYRVPPIKPAVVAELQYDYGGVIFNVYVLVDRPATLRAIEAEALYAESNNWNLKLGVCQTLRFSEPILKFQISTREVALESEIG
jgi:hypothetical protein